MIRSIGPAIAVNMAMGLIYVWSLFLLPLEAALGTSRGTLSLVASLALAAFTIGMVIHAGLLSRLGATPYATLVFLLVGGGHLLFGLAPTYATLLAGYGLAFGLAAGLGYGLALALATGVDDAQRATAVGLVMAAFALSGILLPLLVGRWIAESDPAASFRWIGWACLALGAIIVTGLYVLSPRLGGAGEPGKALPVRMLSSEFLRLFLVFFLMCFVGLMLVAQVSGIATSQGLAGAVVLASTSVFTSGYLLGSLLGGRLVERIGGWALVGMNLLAMAGSLALGVPFALPVLAGAGAIGFSFGSTASIMPVLIGLRFGAQWIGAIYGRMMVAYGLAGMLAPWISGMLYEASRSYASALMLAAMASLVGAVLGLGLRRLAPVLRQSPR